MIDDDIRPRLANTCGDDLIREIKNRLAHKEGLGVWDADSVLLGRALEVLKSAEVLK